MSNLYLQALSQLADSWWVSTINPSDAIGGSNDSERVQHVTEVIVIPKGILNPPKKSRHTIVEDHDPNGNTARRVRFEGNLCSGY
jgi:hypothetical protein